MADQIVVGDTPSVRDLLAAISEDRRIEIEREERRAEMAQKIAQYRWAIASSIHKLKDGRSKLNFESHPFQPTILQDPATDMIIYGSAQWGKSEILIAHAMSSAGICGMSLIWVISKKEKRDKFVADRINPCIESNPHYRKMMETARVRGANADSTGLKHIGEGSINFVYATTENEFTTYSGTSVIVDEHQECPLVNLRQLDNRMSGTEWGYFMRVGHPDLEGTEENANLDYLYQMSDRRVWQVPCPFCRVPQELNWEDHVVAVTRNRSGGITKIVPRDQEWSPSSVLDMRPVCRECHAPMIRLTKRAEWVATNPGVSRHGYNLGNIYNPSPMCALSKLFERYLSARHSPNDMKEFYNKVLGKPFSMGTEKITEAMLGNCSTGEMTGVAPYRFVSISQMDWRRAEEIAAEAA
jgi:phage terminase large subunit GpA-like protein